MIVTGTEVEALHLEQNLVKRHRPPFNVRLRDDKSFPYIAVTVEDEYPRVMFTRERHRRGVWYFGPYANAKKVRETLDVLNRVFPYRPCEGPKPGRHSGIPCLDYHIDRCLAPCVGYVSKEDYRAIIDSVIEFLSGDVRPIQRELEQKMQDAAARRSASRTRRATATGSSRCSTSSSGRRSSASRSGTVDVDRLRGGRRPRGRADLPAARRQDGRPALVPSRERRGPGPDDGARGVLPRVLRVGAERAAADRRAARRRRPLGARRVPVGEARRAASRCAPPSAARSAGCSSSPTRTRGSRSSTEQAATEQKRARRVEALEELREALNLESLPLRIECYDISHAMGQDPVGSMVVFQDAMPRKSDYRKFGIKDASDDPDDFAAMAEVISRRFARLSDGTGETHDASFASAPNLVVIDGGKGQLSAALAAMQAYDLPRVAVIALAKRIEEVFVPGPERADRALAAQPGPAAAPADPRRGAPLRARLPPAAARVARLRLDLRRPRGDRAGAPARAAQPLRLGRRDARRRRRRSSRACQASRRRRRARSTRSSTRPAAARCLAPAQRVPGTAFGSQLFYREITLRLRPRSRVRSMELHYIADDLEEHTWYVDLVADFVEDVLRFAALVAEPAEPQPDQG